MIPLIQKSFITNNTTPLWRLATVLGMSFKVQNLKTLKAEIFGGVYMNTLAYVGFFLMVFSLIYLTWQIVATIIDHFKKRSNKNRFMKMGIDFFVIIASFFMMSTYKETKADIQAEKQESSLSISKAKSEKVAASISKSRAKSKSIDSSKAESNSESIKASKERASIASSKSESESIKKAEESKKASESVAKKASSESAQRVAESNSIAESKAAAAKAASESARRASESAAQAVSTQKSAATNNATASTNNTTGIRWAVEDGYTWATRKGHSHRLSPGEPLPSGYHYQTGN